MGVAWYPLLVVLLLICVGLLGTSAWGVLHHHREPPATT